MQVITKYFSEFSERQLQQFAALEALYQDWNSKINVISRKDIDALYEKHVLHSLSIAAVFDFPSGIDIIDVGTGGGFPGVPLAIFFPEVRFHLVDSIGKKLKIVEAVKDELELKNITTQHSRAEEVKHKKFDFAISRAVAPLKDLLHWTKPLLKPATHKITAAGEDKIYKPGLICLKGGDLKNEIAESGTRPQKIELSSLFEEEFFKEKYLLYCPPKDELRK